MKKRLLVLILLVSGCIARKDIKVVLLNDSGKAFDSAVVRINNHTLTIKQMALKGKFEMDIPVDSIRTNPHEVMLMVSLYAENGTDTLSGMFYTDLGGRLSDKYEIQITKERKLSISPGSY